MTLLNPILITNINVVNQLYEQINTYNDLLTRMLVLSDIVNIEVSKKIFDELSVNRTELMKT